MIKAVLVDDEVHCLDTLSILLKDHCPQVQVMQECRSATQALEAINIHHPDVVFLDVEMPMMNGFDMLERLKQIPFAVVFTTGYDQYAIRAIHVSALDYLLKPIDPPDLIAAVSKIHAHKQLPSQQQLRLLLDRMTYQQRNRVAVPTFEGFEMIAADAIVHCKADDNYTHFFLKNNRSIIACRTLKQVEDMLLAFPFFIRVHNSHVVNLNEVTRYIRGEGGYLVMSDNTTVNVSRGRKEALLRVLTC